MKSWTAESTPTQQRIMVLRVGLCSGATPRNTARQRAPLDLYIRRNLRLTMRDGLLGDYES